MHEGMLVLGDDQGSIFMLDYDGQVIWQNNNKGDGAAKMVIVLTSVVKIRDSVTKSIVLR